MHSTLIRDRADTRAAALIGIASGLGARDPGCADGPAALRAVAPGGQFRAEWTEMLAPLPDGAVAVRIAELCGRLAARVEPMVAERRRFAVVGGDHSCAVGTWSGAANALAGRGRPGLVWIDAHMDSHTPETTPSGTYHGMPLACLLGHGDDALTRLAVNGPALDPAHVCLVGVRSYEPAEPRLLDRLGVHVFYMDEVARRGIAAVLREAVGIALDGTAVAGISIDLDAIDPAEAPGVGSPVSGGLAGAKLVEAVGAIGRDPRIIGCEVVEYNPSRDRGGRTAALAAALLAAFFGGPTR